MCHGDTFVGLDLAQVCQPRPVIDPRTSDLYPPRIPPGLNDVKDPEMARIISGVCIGFDSSSSLQLLPVSSSVIQYDISLISQSSVSLAMTVPVKSRSLGLPNGIDLTPNQTHMSIECIVSDSDGGDGDIPGDDRNKQLQSLPLQSTVSVNQVSSGPPDGLDLTIPISWTCRIPLIPPLVASTKIETSLTVAQQK